MDSVVEEKLYPDLPPTMVRGKEEKFKEADTNPFWCFLGKFIFLRLLKHRFCAFRYRGYEDYLNAGGNTVPTIIFSVHSNWWDGLVLYHIANFIMNREVRIMVEELNRFPILRHAGAFSVNKKSAQSSMKALQYAIKQACNTKNVLALFPQGIIRPPHYRPIVFQTGLAYMAQGIVKKFGKVNLVPIALDYKFLRDNRPEILVTLSKPITLTDGTSDRKELTHFLEQELEKVCEEQEARISKGEVDNYKILFRQVKWYRYYEQWIKRVDKKDLLKFKNNHK